MDNNRDYLIELDGVMGDSDLGLTMQKSFSAANDLVSETVEEKPGKLLMKVGMKIASVAPSTMGTLLARGFMSGGKSVADIENIFLNDFAIFFRAFTQGIMDAGKTKPGNKTIVDSLDPVASALEMASVEGKSLREGIVSAYDAALKGVEDSKAMKAQHGRAAYYQEKSIGVQDPGATLGAFFVEGFLIAASDN